MGRTAKKRAYLPLYVPYAVLVLLPSAYQRLFLCLSSDSDVTLDNEAYSQEKGLSVPLCTTVTLNVKVSNNAGK